MENEQYEKARNRHLSIFKILNIEDANPLILSMSLRWQLKDLYMARGGGDVTLERLEITTRACLNYLYDEMNEQ
jgi:hypothetical protein